MVFKHVNIIAVALYVSLLPKGNFGKGFITIAHSVTFEISFPHHINAVAVAQIVPPRVVGILTGAHGVEGEIGRATGRERVFYSV